MNDAATAMFKYDHNGLRTEKYVKQNGTETTTKYIYSGTRLVHMTQGSNWLHFFYDGSGQPAEMNFNGTVYIYVKNLQGDIVGIVDTTGRIVVEYKYDAWGRPTYSNSLVDSNSTLTARYALMLNLNPFRYRGYVYDDEIGLYYLKSRYYSPKTYRFINADEFINIRKAILYHNLFAYCVNNPITSNDENGHFLKSVKKSVFIISTIIKSARIIVPAVASEVQLVVNRQKAKGALVGSVKKQIDYLENDSCMGFANAVIEGITGKYLWFYNQVNHNAPMDYKVKARRPWWALDTNSFCFRGKIITFEEYGNLNYGYVGKALGFPDWIIFAGGGFAAVTSGGDTSYRIDYFFDSEEDHDNVAWGIEIYNEMWGND